MPPRWGWERRASPLIQRQGTLALSLREREQRIPRSDESRRSGLAKALRAVLPLLGERAGVRGKKRCAHQRACELPMKSATRSEGTQSSTAGKATCPWQLQADFPLTLALSLREREQHIPRCDESRRSGLARAQRAVLPLPGPLPARPSRGEGEDSLSTHRLIRWQCPRALALAPAGRRWSAAPMLPLLLLLQFWFAPAAFAQSDLSGRTTEEARAERIYFAARARLAHATNRAEAAWQFARACFDWAEFAAGNAPRAQIAIEGIAACRHAIALNPQLAAPYYYLALNLGQLARTKKLGALKLVEEMETNFKAAIALDPAFDYAGAHRSLGLLYLDA